MAYPYSLLVQSIVRESLTFRMLAVPHRLRHSVLESNHIVLPVANMIADVEPEVYAAKVVRVEVHVEGIDQAVSVIIDDDGGGNGVASLARAIWRHPEKPLRVLFDVVVGCQEHFLASEVVQTVQVVEGQGIRGTADSRKVDLRLGIRELSADV